MLDLHLHTHFSDGTLSPRELVEEAHRAGLNLISVTDHDHVGGIAEAQEAAGPLGMAVIPGVEINTNHEGHEVHILGYFLDTRHPELQTTLAEQRRGRQERTRRMVKKLQEKGLPISLSDVEGRPELDSTLGRPHVAAALVRAGCVSSVEEAFQRYLGSRCPGYIPQLGMTVDQAIALIRRAGGLAVLAHPGLWRANGDRVGWLVSLGLGGLEVYYPKHSTEQQARYHELAEQYGLIMTGSSDYHGPVEHSAGPIGGTPVPPEVEERFRALARERGFPVK